MASISVLLADDHAILRAGLRLLVSAQADMEVVGEAADTREAVEKVRLLEPDVLTLDLTMPGGSSIKMIERLRTESPKTRVLVLTMHDDAAYLRAALAAGAAGYMTKSVVDTKLMDAIRAVHQGQIVVDVKVAAEDDFAQSARHAAPESDRATGYASLSPREREVLTMLAQGHSNQQMADRLFLSVKTVETYRARIGEKLGLRTRPELVRYALEVGVLKREHPHRARAVKSAEV